MLCFIFGVTLVMNTILQKAFISHIITCNWTNSHPGRRRRNMISNTNINGTILKSHMSNETDSQIWEWVCLVLEGTCSDLIHGFCISHIEKYINNGKYLNEYHVADFLCSGEIHSDSTRSQETVFWLQAAHINTEWTLKATFFPSCWPWPAAATSAASPPGLLSWFCKCLCFAASHFFCAALVLRLVKWATQSQTSVAQSWDMEMFGST